MTALTALVALAGRAAILTQPVNSDTAMFVYMGKLLDGGGRMGVDLVDNKLPTVGVLMWTPYKLFGDAWWAYGVLGLAMTLVASVALARAARRALGEPALLPVGLAAALWMNFPPMVHGHLQLETIQVLFTSLAGGAALVLLSRRSALGALAIGACAGVAILAKPTAGVVVLASAAAIALGTRWAWRERVTSIAHIMIGLIVPVALCVLILHLTDQIEPLPGVIAQLRDYSANSSLRGEDAIKLAIAIGLLMFPALAWRTLDRRARPGGDSAGGVGVFVLAWFVLELLAVVMQRRMYAYHFLVLAPPAALMVGLAVRRVSAARLALALGPVALLSATFATQIIVSRDRDARYGGVVRYLHEHAGAGERVWMDDCARLLVETDLAPGARVPLVFLFANSDDAPRRLGSIVLDDLERRRPEWIVLYDDPERFIRFYQNHMVEIAEHPRRRENFAAAWRAIDRWVRDRYEVCASVERMQVLRRRVSPGPILPADRAGSDQTAAASP